MKTTVRIVIVHLLAACSIMPAARASAQNMPIEQSRREIAAASAGIDSLIHTRQMLADSAAILAFEIRSLTGAAQGRKEHRRLENLLAVSKEITGRDRAVEQELARRNTRLAKLNSAHSALLGKAVDSLISAAAGASVSAQKDLAKQAAALTKEKHSIDLLTYREDMDIVAPAHIEARQWDTPASLRRKSSMLTDRALSLNRQKKRLNKLIHELENEQRVRDRLNEFSIDMALFNENEEHSISSVQTHIQAQETYDSNSEKLRGSENVLPLSEDISRTMPGDTGSAGNLQEFIHSIKSHAVSIGSAADSLHMRARVLLNIAVKRETDEQQ